MAAVAGLVLTFAEFSAPAFSSAAAAAVSPVVPAASQLCLPVSNPVTPAPAPKAALGGVFDGVKLSALQVTSASTIASVGKSMKITRRGIRIGIAVAMQESSLDPAAKRDAYLGLFQQRSDASSGLYTQYNRLDATAATRMFFQQLVKRVPGYETDPRLDWQVGEVIQETNVGRNVEQWFGLSDALTTKLLGAPIITLIVPASKSTKPVQRGVTGSPARGAAPAMVPALRSAGSAFAPAAYTVTGGDPSAVDAAAAAVSSDPSTTSAVSTSPDSADPAPITSPTESTSPSAPPSSSSPSAPTTSPAVSTTSPRTDIALRTDDIALRTDDVGSGHLSSGNQDDAGHLCAEHLGEGDGSGHHYPEDDDEEHHLITLGSDHEEHANCTDQVGPAGRRLGQPGPAGAAGGDWQQRSFGRVGSHRSGIGRAGDDSVRADRLQPGH